MLLTNNHVLTKDQRTYIQSFLLTFSIKPKVTIKDDGANWFRRMCITISQSNRFEVFIIIAILIGRAIPAWQIPSIQYSNPPLVLPVLYPIGTMAITGSILMTVLLSVERYVAVIKKKEIKIRKIMSYMAYITLFAIFSGIPTTLVYKYEVKDGVIHTKLNELSCNGTMLKVYNVTLAFFRFILPIFCLIVSNFRIFKEVSLLVHPLFFVFEV